MNPLTQAVILSASTLRMIPHIILYMANRSKIAPDLEKYSADGSGMSRALHGHLHGGFDPGYDLI